METFISPSMIEEYQSPTLVVHTIQTRTIVCTSQQNEQTTEEELF